MLRRSYSFQQQLGTADLGRQRSVSLSRSSSFIAGSPYTAYQSQHSPFSRTSRTYMPSNSYRIPLVQSYGVVSRAPRYSDRYPHIQYSGYGDLTHGLTVTDYRGYLRSGHYAHNLKPLRQYTNSGAQYSNVKLNSTYGYSAPRYGTPVRPYVHHLGVDDAVDLYKKRCMTSGALVKYWLTPTKMELRRQRELRDIQPLLYGSPAYQSIRSRRPFSYRLAAM